MGEVNDALNERTSPTFVDSAPVDSVKSIGTDQTFTFATPSVWDVRSSPLIFVPTMTGWPSESMMRYSPSGTASVADAPEPSAVVAASGFASDFASADATARVFAASVRWAMVPASSQPFVRSVPVLDSASDSHALAPSAFTTSTLDTLPPDSSAFSYEPMRYAMYLCPVSVPPATASSSIVASVSAMAAGAAPIASNAANAVAVIILMFAIALFSLVSSRPAVPVGSRSMTMP